MGHHGNSFITFAVERFLSLYESFQALTSVQLTHFWDFFSGSDLDSIWTKTNTVGANTFAMADAVDGGFLITTAGAAFDRGSINFNNIEQYSPTSSIFISVWKSDKTDNVTLCGFTGNNITDPAANSTQQALSESRTTETNFTLQTGDASTGSRTASSIATDTIYHNHKLELGSANVKYYIDGVLEVTKTTNRPTVNMQPLLEVSAQAASAKTANIQHLECFNTGVSILSSLYERLSPLTQVLKQRVVEAFSASVLNARWTQTDTSGTGTFAMADEVDGGFSITTQNAALAYSLIDFNDKRQYAFNNSIMLFVQKRVSGSSSLLRTGLQSDSAEIPADYARIEASSFSNDGLRTRDGATATLTTGSIAGTQNWTLYKLELSASNAKMFVNGVLDITKSTNLPTAKLQPFFGARRDTTVACQGQIRYLEAYNKLAVQTDYPSVYELFNKLTTLAKQHFWDWFSGNDIGSRWTKTNITGTGTFAMADEIDGGFSITTGATSGDKSEIDFNDKRQFAHNASQIIVIAKRIDTSCLFRTGFTSNITGTGLNRAFAENQQAQTFYRTVSSDGSTETAQNTSINTDTNWHNHKLELGASNVKHYIDGVLEVTKSTNLPTSKVQPFFFMQSQSTGAKAGRIRYCEAKYT